MVREGGGVQFVVCEEDMVMGVTDRFEAYLRLLDMITELAFLSTASQELMS